MLPPHTVDSQTNNTGRQTIGTNKHCQTIAVFPWHPNQTGRPSNRPFRRSPKENPRQKQKSQWQTEWGTRSQPNLIKRKMPPREKTNQFQSQQNPSCLTNKYHKSKQASSIKLFRKRTRPSTINAGRQGPHQTPRLKYGMTSWKATSKMLRQVPKESTLKPPQKK